ncbi:MAG TPA: pilin [Candidatus Saccharibacteria bacterium]|nr:pilin [Candidatus Saccharibacteria bacterium]
MGKILNLLLTTGAISVIKEARTNERKHVMKKSIKLALAGLMLVPVLAFGLVATTSPAVSAEDLGGIRGAIDKTKSDEQPATLFGDGGVFTNVINIALFIIGALAVLMLIIGGIRYTISGGDTAAVTAAKNTILYAIIGIIVAILAYAIVNFVLVNLASS